MNEVSTSQMPTPIESFEMPPELGALLDPAAGRDLMKTITNINQRFLERDRATEDGRSEGRHLWELFDAIASELWGNPDFSSMIINFIPELIDKIRTELGWHPHNFQGDLRPYYLKAPISKWQLIFAGKLDHPVNQHNPTPLRNTNAGESPVRRRELNVALINKWIDDEGYNNEDLAMTLRVSTRTISSIRNNNAFHGRRAVVKLANQMKCDLEDLYLT